MNQSRMSSTNKDNNEDQLKGDNKSDSLKSIKAAELESIRQNLAKRSLDAKFDLQGSDYKPVENIGIGAYGVVCSAIHIKSGDRVAIKKIPNVFEALSIAKRTYREIKILKHFKHDNIISIREILMPKQNVKDFKDIYVVFGLMESDLHRIIYSKQELSEEHIRYFLYQILRGLKYIHSANVIHRDLKPSNVLVNEDCHLRIGDFGMARGVFYTPDEPSYYMTQYVATRWYRAPEILLSMLEYGAALDMWSVGCIFAEMMGRKHLFPGKDYISQVKLIVGVLGTPSEVVLRKCHHDILKKMIKGFGKKEPISWGKLFPKASKKSLDLVSKMLVINPADRISVDQALAHRLLNKYHDPSDEPVCVPPFNFDFEKEDMDKVRLREVIMEEIMSFHQPKQPTLSFNAFLRPAPKSEETISKVVKIDTFSGDTLIPTDQPTQVDENKKERENEIILTTNVETKSSNKISPVSVDIGKLQVMSSADIEMLSAQSADGRAMETHHSHVLSVDKEVKEKGRPVLDDKIVTGEKDCKISGDKKGGNTISDDTRALVKQALMNATQRRQRAESQGDESKDTKPVTAAQRQREREERRRKKKERALEKVKKNKEKKQSPSIGLTSEDMELLRRWTVMQNPGQSEHVSQSPPHPGPAVSPPQAATTMANNSASLRSFINSCGKQNPEVSINSQQTVYNSHVPSGVNKPRQIFAKTAPAPSLTMTPASGAVLFPSTQLTISQANFIPVIAVPSSINPGHLEIKRMFQPANVTTNISITSVAPSLQTSDTTHSDIHTSVQRRNQISSGTDMQTLDTQNDIQTSLSSDVIQNENVSPVSLTHVSFPDMHTHVDESATPQRCIATHDEFVTSAVGTTNLLKPEPTEISKDDQLSPRSQGNDLLEFLNHHLKESPLEKPVLGVTNPGPMQSVYLDQNHCLQEQNSYLLSGPSSQDSQQHNLTPPPSYSNYSQTCSPQEQIARSNSTPSLLRQNSHSPNSQQQQNGQRSSVPLVTCGDHLYLNFTSPDNFSMSFQVSDKSQAENFPQPNTTNFQPNFISQNDYQDYSQAAAVINFDSQIPHPSLLFQSSSQYSLHMQPQQLCRQFENAGSYEEFHEFSSSTSRSSVQQYHQDFVGYSQPQQQNFCAHQGFQASNYGNTTATHITPQLIPAPILPDTASLNSTTASTSSETFTSSLLQQSDQSVQGHKLTVNCSSLQRVSDSNSELITLLTKQLSKQHVIDIVPSLALTPRGTGAGYGVGMDLDAVLTDAQDNASNVRAEQSPLSSSLLEDWMAISENISQADLEAIARELALQSPMHVSYDGSM